MLYKIGFTHVFLWNSKLLFKKDYQNKSIVPQFEFFWCNFWIPERHVQLDFCTIFHNYNKQKHELCHDIHFGKELRTDLCCYWCIWWIFVNKFFYCSIFNWTDFLVSESLLSSKTFKPVIVDWFSFFITHCLFLKRIRSTFCHRSFSEGIFSKMYHFYLFIKVSVTVFHSFLVMSKLSITIFFIILVFFSNKCT